MQPPRTGRACLGIALTLAVLVWAWSNDSMALGADPPSPAAAATSVAGRAAIRPAAPVVPGEIIAALQDGNFESARGGLKKLSENEN